MGAEFFEQPLDIFLSYSGKDRNLAMRLYDDLARSGFSIWRYERDSVAGVDFIREFENRLKAAQIFCLLDSDAARQSNYVAAEITMAWERHIKGQLSHYIVCLAQPDGIWRKRIATPYSPFFLPELNKLRYFDFSWADTDDVFDPFDRYQSAVIKLVEFLDGHFTPYLPVPWVKNFEDELYNTPTKIDLDERKILLEDYAAFYHYYNTHQLGHAERRLKLIQEDWGVLNLVSPLLAHGTLLFEQEKLLEANNVFSKLISTNPKNPMGWWGLAITQLHLDQTSKSIFSIEQAIALANEDNPHHRAVLPNLWHYKLHGLMQKGDFKGAELALETIPPHFQETPEVRIAKTWLFFLKGEIDQAQINYMSLYYLIETPARNSLAINESLAFLALKFAEWAIEQSALELTRFYLEQRVKLIPKKIRAWAELAELYNTQGELRSQKGEIISTGLALKPNSAEDLYFYGLLHYLVGNEKNARLFYLKSGCDHWRYYGS